jgi:hypothetical protein
MIGSADMLRMLGVKINFFSDPAGLNAIESKLNGLIGQAKSVAGVFAGAFAVNYAKNFIKEGLAFGDQLHDQAQRLGVSIEELQKWSFVAEKAGASSESMTKAFGFFNRMLGEAQLGTKVAVETLRKLGFTPEQIKNTNNANDLMFAFADKLKALPTDAQRFAYAQRILGRGGKEVALVLAQGTDAIIAQQKALEEAGGVLDGKTGEQIDNFGDRLIIINKAYEVGKAKLIATLIPALAVLAETFLKVTKTMAEFNKQTGLVTIAIGAMSAAFVLAGIKMAIAWAPAAILVGTFAAGLVLAYLAAEDLYYFFTDKGDSLTEELIKGFYGVEDGTKTIKELREAFKDVKDFLPTVAEGFHTITTAIKETVAGVKELISIASKLKPVADFFLGSNPLGTLVGLAGAVPKAIITTNNLLNENPEGVAPKMPTSNMIGIAPTIRTTPIPDQVNALGNPIQTNNLTFNISGGDPQDTEAAVGRALDKHLFLGIQDFKTVKAQ